jgi:hypothetical protein
LKSGKWEEKDVELKAYQMCAEELTATKAGDLLLKGSRIVISNNRGFGGQVVSALAFHL